MLTSSPVIDSRVHRILLQIRAVASTGDHQDGGGVAVGPITDRLCIGPEVSHLDPIIRLFLQQALPLLPLHLRRGDRKAFVQSRQERDGPMGPSVACQQG